MKATLGVCPPFRYHMTFRPFSSSRHFFFLSKRWGTLLSLEPFIIIFKTPASTLPKTTFGERAADLGTAVKHLLRITFQVSPSVRGIMWHNYGGSGTRIAFQGPRPRSHAWLHLPFQELVGERFWAGHCRPVMLCRGAKRRKKWFVLMTFSKASRICCYSLWCWIKELQKPTHSTTSAIDKFFGGGVGIFSLFLKICFLKLW